MRLRLLVLTALAALLLLASVVIGTPSSVPSPQFSTLDPCMVFCPTGDITYHVTVRDLAQNPISGSIVVLDFSQCAGWHVCSDPGPGITADLTLRTLRMTTNAQGEAFFAAKVGGVCASSVKVYADGVQLNAGSLTLSSPDQDGSLLVTPADQAILVAKIAGGTDPTGDLNCSATTDSTDLGPLAAHMNHGCNGVIPVRPGSWGRLKTTYR